MDLELTCLEIIIYICRVYIYLDETIHETLRVARVALNLRGEIYKTRTSLDLIQVNVTTSQLDK